MKASQLIKELQACVDEYGDLPVHFGNGKGEVTVSTVHVYDECGFEPERDNTSPFEIYLHGTRVAQKAGA